MADTRIVARPAATSWGAVIGGWVATVGMSVILSPLVAGLIAAAGTPNPANQLAFAVPVVLGLLLSYMVGGYVAGRMAGYRTSWHGMMTAFFSLFVLLVILLVAGLADRGVFATSGIRSLTDVIPGASALSVDSIGNALSFGAILGFLAAIFGGWLGGLMAPSHLVVAPAPAVAASPVTTTPMATRTERTVVQERPRRTLLPAFGRKGGERVEEHRVDEVKQTQVDRRV
jgi:hypothetical protein